MLRHATIADVPRIAELISLHARQGKMLFRSHAELYETLRDFMVAQEPDEPHKVVGVCALEIVWADLAEVKSLAVYPNYQKRGIGRGLVEAVIQEAKELKIYRVFALTYEADFFARLGFHTVERDTLPLKVWSDCVKCPKRDGCDEIAVVREILPRPVLEEISPNEMGSLRYEVPTPLVKLNLPAGRRI